MFAHSRSILTMLSSFMVSGGPFMLPLFLLCFVMWFLILDRIRFFKQLHTMNKKLKKHYTHTPTDTAVSQKNPVEIFILQEFLRKQGNPQADNTIIDEICYTMTRRSTTFLAIIGVLAAAAPLLGLLGTVNGMMKTFNVLSIFGPGNAKALASGISEALITTQSGLLIAIPGLYMKSFLQRRADSLERQIRLAGYSLKHQILCRKISSPSGKNFQKNTAVQHQGAYLSC